MDKKLSVRDVLAMKRDFYQGTKFDLSKGVAGGPYGDPRRFDGAVSSAYNQNNLTDTEMAAGGFERSVSMFRTSYSVVSVSRAASPGNELTKAVVWVAQYAPHMATYTPVYPAAAVDQAVPPPLSTGSLWRLDKTSGFWRACTVGNWAAHFFRYAWPDVVAVQASLEDRAFVQQAAVEAAAHAAIDAGDRAGADQMVADFSGQAAARYIDEYSELFDNLVSREGLSIF